jgi:hypothetical protein
MSSFLLVGEHLPVVNEYDLSFLHDFVSLSENGTRCLFRLWPCHLVIPEKTGIYEKMYPTPYSVRPIFTYPDIASFIRI